MIILQYRPCANIIGVLHLKIHESAREMHFKYKQTIGMGSGEACSLNSLPLPLQAAEMEQYPLDKIYFRRYVNISGARP